MINIWWYKKLMEENKMQEEEFNKICESVKNPDRIKTLNILEGINIKDFTEEQGRKLTQLIKDMNSKMQEEANREIYFAG